MKESRRTRARICSGCHKGFNIIRDRIKYDQHIMDIINGLRQSKGQEYRGAEIYNDI